MISEIKPKKFKAKFEATGCYIIYNNKILLLKRAEIDDGHQNTYGTPGGKIDNETPQENIIREIEEETGIIIKTNKLKFFNTTYVIYPDIQFIYHAFTYKMDKMPKITLSSEHLEFLWIEPAQALKLPLVPDEDKIIKKVFGLN